MYVPSSEESSSSEEDSAFLPLVTGVFPLVVGVTGFLATSSSEK